jgi:hypothetical protein
MQAILITAMRMERANMNANAADFHKMGAIDQIMSDPSYSYRRISTSTVRCEYVHNDRERTRAR